MTTLVSTYQTVAPLEELWKAHVLPALDADPDPRTVVARVNLRRVSKLQREWDRAFVTPPPWDIKYQLTARATFAAAALRNLAFIGWDHLPPARSWDVILTLDFQVVVAAESMRVARARRPLDGDLGSRTVLAFDIGFWADDRVGVKVSLMDVAGQRFFRPEGCRLHHPTRRPTPASVSPIATAPLANPQRMQPRRTG
jgi:hypothetical protein